MYNLKLTVRMQTRIIILKSNSPFKLSFHCFHFVTNCEITKNINILQKKIPLFHKTSSYEAITQYQDTILPELFLVSKDTFLFSRSPQQIAKSNFSKSFTCMFPSSFPFHYQNMEGGCKKIKLLGYFLIQLPHS